MRKPYRIFPIDDPPQEPYCGYRYYMTKREALGQARKRANDERRTYIIERHNENPPAWWMGRTQYMPTGEPIAPDRQPNL